MSKFRLAVVSALAVASLAMPLAVIAAAPTPVLYAAETNLHAGRVVIDVGRHGEAWYVMPDGSARVSLGRPSEAVAALASAAVSAPMQDILKIPTVSGMPHDADYVESVLGQVLRPSDVVGALWYVDPTLRVRRPIASAWDAWEIMRFGTPVRSAEVDALPERETPPVTETAVCESVVATNTIRLEGGREVRLLNVDAPDNLDLQSAAKAWLAALCEGKTVTLERDVAEADLAGRLARHVLIGDVYLNLDVVRRGWAFHDIESPNFKYAEQMIVAGLDAKRLQSGFWHH
jgi:endonuclease YncB( thermonuclease family)